LPLVLVGELLGGVAEQDDRERRAIEASATGTLLEERDRVVLDVLRGERAGARLLARLDAHLAADRAERASALEVETRHGVSQRARGLLQHLNGSRLAELREEALRVLGEREEAQRELAWIPTEAKPANNLRGKSKIR
jgi:hypothetical protein